MSKTNAERSRIALVDDEPARFSLAQALELRGYKVDVFNLAEVAIKWPGLESVDCIISDVRMPGMDGEEFLAEIVRQRLPPPIVMITGHGDVAMAVRCLKAGAYDFVEKPFDTEVLLASVARAVELSALRREGAELKRRLDSALAGNSGHHGMIGLSRAIQDVYEQIETTARYDSPVLITGETGVGKELVARAIHELSARREKAFIPVNAGALADATLESELFGHVKGAFTGAEIARDGRLVTASGGTLLLDEVESLSMKAQVQLLRVLEDGIVVPLGSDQARRTDVRLLATTKSDVRELVRRGVMRDDFCHRINVLEIRVPPLRERSEDIVPLFSHFLRRSADRAGVAAPHVPEEVLGRLLRWSWPGNVRELRNAAERMFVTSRDGVAGPFGEDESFGGERLLSLPATQGRLRDELERTERSVIEAALRDLGGEITASAAALGISRRALYDRLRKYGLAREDFRD